VVVSPCWRDNRARSRRAASNAGLIAIAEDRSRRARVFWPEDCVGLELGGGILGGLWLGNRGLGKRLDLVGLLGRNGSMPRIF
jgi:hypothetical protein